MSALLALVFAFAAQTPNAPGIPPQIMAAIAKALARDPKTLPLAPEEKWHGWTPKDEVPAEARPLMAEGMHAYTDADYGHALACFLALLDKQPDYPAALYQGGSTYFRLRRYGDCATLLERFVRAVPTEIGATQALGHSYYSLGQYERAKEHYEKVVAASPQSVEAWRGLGLTHMRLGDDEHALECLRRALDLRPDHAEARGWYAQVLFDTGRTKDALSEAERARDLAPFEPRHWYLLVQIYGDLGRDEDATKARARFTELNRIDQDIRAQEATLLHDPFAISALRKLVELQLEANDAAEAREAVQRLLRIAPQDYANHVLALQTLHTLHDKEGARKVAEGIEKLFPTNVEAWKLLSGYYADAGDPAGTARADQHLRALGAKK